MKMVNLGCGSHYHKDWTNIDLVSPDSMVISHDLTRGIPLDDDSCDVVYHSHMIEHLKRDDASRFMSECHRVLTPGGIVRVATPNLEQICHIYLEKLDSARVAGAEVNAPDYDWIMLEMYDQMVRERSGGQMVDYLKQNPILNEAFVYERIGEEGRNLIRQLRETRTVKREIWANRPNAHNVGIGIDRVIRKVRDDVLARLILGQEGHDALKIGRFRKSGEIHHWIYDQHSLSVLMSRVGFREMMTRSADTSAIYHWSSYHLDTMPDGSVYKPDSIYMEAVKPLKK